MRNARVYRIESHEEWKTLAPDDGRCDFDYSPAMRCHRAAVYAVCLDTRIPAIDAADLASCDDDESVTIEVLYSCDEHLTELTNGDYTLMGE